MALGSIFNIQRYSLHDGPGIRTTVFFKGCPLDCWWCHNPESRSPDREPYVVESRCVKCGHCSSVCPRCAEGSHDDAEEFFPCMHCENDGDVCPVGARSILGTGYSVADLMKEILKDRIFFDESGGGVTFSGGEPLMQIDFLREILQACRKEGVHTAVDTSGFALREEVLSIAPLVDLFLYDVKAIDDMTHIQYVGVSNQSILDNFKALTAVHNNVWLRFPLIPTVNDGAQIEDLASFASTVGNVRQVNILPYHKVGSHKFSRIGETARLTGVEAPSDEAVEAAAECFRRRGLNVVVGG